jgi:hypothetical protein
MAHYLIDIEKEVYERLKADTGTGGLFSEASGEEPLVSSVWNDEAPEATNPWWTAQGLSPEDPMIVFYCDTIADAETTETVGREVALTLEVYVRARPEDGTVPTETMGLILDRLEGNWYAQSSGVPSYGLVRWEPTLDGGWSFVGGGWAIDRIDREENPDWKVRTMRLVGRVDKVGA